jgi:hypothetical protein
MTSICTLCGNNRFELKLEIAKPDRFETALGISELGYSRKWNECSKCGLFFNDNSITNQNLLNSIGHRYYEIDFGKENLGNRFIMLKNLPKENSDNYFRVKRVKDYYTEFVSKNLIDSAHHNILDVGAGLGVFLDAFVTIDWNGTAIEPDPYAFEHLNVISNKRFDVINDVYKAGLVGQKYDLITFNKVLEHLRNPVDLLNLAKYDLNDDKSLVYVEVPDLLTCTKKNFNDNILGSLHFNLYDPYTLSLLFKNSGLTPVKVERIIEPSGKITTYGFATK